MPQIFHRSTNTLSRATIFGAVFVVAALSWVAMEIQRSPYVTYAGVRKPQPCPSAISITLPDSASIAAIVTPRSRLRVSPAFLPPRLA